MTLPTRERMRPVAITIAHDTSKTRLIPEIVAVVVAYAEGRLIDPKAVKDWIAPMLDRAADISQLRDWIDEAAGNGDNDDE